MKIGAHVSSSGGIDKSIGRAEDIQAEAIQLFITPPQGWAKTKHTEESIISFRSKRENSNIGPVFFHGIYLINLATDNAVNLDKSIDSLIYYMNFAEKLGAQGVIFHIGSHKGAGLEAVFPQIIDSFNKILDGSPSDGVSLCIENNAGHGNQIGSNFDELGEIIGAVGDDRLQVCLDTCHLLASGYDIREKDSLSKVMMQFDEKVGAERLVAVHANDAKSDLGSNLDRHENIGDGFIGLDGWEAIIGNKSFENVPFFLEVPGIKGRTGPDLENVLRLKKIRDSLGVSI
jgi:deoxyribonuclease-4|tara:strand:+ start:1934 stop:2797 length:864 start_codon:yes stop_codon:yes gene_type:complete